SPDDFFRDDLLSIFLYEQIGDKRYRLLADKYSHSEMILQNSDEITKDFLEVFKLNNDDLINTPTDVENIRSEFSKTKKQKPALNENDIQPLDWELISDRIEQSFKISPDNLLENQDLIINLHAFYGIDEMTIIEFIGKTCDIVNNKIDPDRLKKSIQDRFEKNANISARQQPEMVETKDDETHNFNRSDQLILQQAKKLTPADFLAAQKQKSGGYVGKVEANALRDLAMKAYLPSSVINIMVYYILQSSSVLSTPFLETVANDWTQNGVKTPEH